MISSKNGCGGPLPFPTRSLPKTVCDYLEEAAGAIGCDACYIGLPLLATLARAIGNKRTIMLKRTWTEPAIVWGALVGRSGTHKSPALQMATSALTLLQTEALAEHDGKLADYERDLMQYERCLAAWRQNRNTVEPPPRKTQEPVCNRYIVGDITIEALVHRLGSQFDGLLVVRDELAGWIDGMGQYKGGKGSDTGHWLATWSGAPLTVDRKTGEQKTIHVPRAAVSIVGGIQPGILRRAIGREHLQDGLCARLLLAMPEPRPITWTEATVRPETEDALRLVFRQLLFIEPATDAAGNPAPLALELTPEARVVWIDYYNRHRNEMVGMDDDLAAAWSKLEAYAARFALIVQLCSWASGEAAADAIDQSSVCAGIALSDWFASEARRVYGLLSETDEVRKQRELVKWIHDRGGSVTVRDLQQHNRTYRARADYAEAALARLVKSELATSHHVEAGPRGGRPCTVYRLSEAAAVNGTA